MMKEITAPFAFHEQRRHPAAMPMAPSTIEVDSALIQIAAAPLTAEKDRGKKTEGQTFC